MSIYSISIRELRPKLPEVVSDIQENMSRYIITKRGKPTAVILNKDEYDSLVESLNLKTNEKLMRQICDSESEFKKSRINDLDDIRRRL